VGVVGRRCVNFGVRWGCENRGVGTGIRLQRVHISSPVWWWDSSLCCRGLGSWLLWWGGEYLLISLMKKVCRVCWPVVLDMCRSVTDKVSVYSV
jgi:hypothetical protein